MVGFTGYVDMTTYPAPWNTTGRACGKPHRSKALGSAWDRPKSSETWTPIRQPAGLKSRLVWLTMVDVDVNMKRLKYGFSKLYIVNLDHALYSSYAQWCSDRPWRFPEMEHRNTAVLIHLIFAFSCQPWIFIMVDQLWWFPPTRTVGYGNGPPQINSRLALLLPSSDGSKIVSFPIKQWGFSI